MSTRSRLFKRRGIFLKRSPQVVSSDGLIDRSGVFVQSVLEFIALSFRPFVRSCVRACKWVIKSLQCCRVKCLFCLLLFSRASARASSSWSSVRCLFVWKIVNLHLHLNCELVCVFFFSLLVLHSHLLLLLLLPENVWSRPRRTAICWLTTLRMRLVGCFSRNVPPARPALLTTDRPTDGCLVAETSFKETTRLCLQQQPKDMVFSHS